jgi:hypothetical protein
MLHRNGLGEEFDASAAKVDSQSVKTTEKGLPRLATTPNCEWLGTLFDQEPGFRELLRSPGRPRQ